MQNLLHLILFWSCVDEVDQRLLSNLEGWGEVHVLVEHVLEGGSAYLVGDVKLGPVLEADVRAESMVWLALGGLSLVLENQLICNTPGLSWNLSFWWLIETQLTELGVLRFAWHGQYWLWRGVLMLEMFLLNILMWKLILWLLECQGIFLPIFRNSFTTLARTNSWRQILHFSAAVLLAKPSSGDSHLASTQSDVDLGWADVLLLGRLIEFGGRWRQHFGFRLGRRFLVFNVFR